MKDVTLVVLKEDPSVDLSVNITQEYVSPLKSLPEQLSSTGVSFDIIDCKLEEIPKEIDSKLIIFVDPSLLIREDYIFNAVTLNNLFRDMGIMFGPIEVETSCSKNIRHIKNSYHRYSLDFGNSNQICDITGEVHNYGTLRNAIISGAAYNRVMFSACCTPRSKILDNPDFINRISKNHKVFYSSNLKRLKCLSDKDFEHATLSDHYYNQGFIDGFRASCLENLEKRKEVWSRFVESPEIIDVNEPRRLFEQEASEENVAYLELLVLLKCKYQIGYFEGFLGKSVL